MASLMYALGFSFALLFIKVEQNDGYYRLMCTTDCSDHEEWYTVTHNLINHKKRRVRTKKINETEFLT